MREYNYQKNYRDLLTPDIVVLLAQIHEFKGEQTRFVESKSDTLTGLMEIAKFQSTKASNRIEGIDTADERLKKLVRDKTTPQTRSEQEIAGYRDVLLTIYKNHAYIPLRPSIIVQLHRDLYKFSGSSTGGVYRVSDKPIAGDARNSKSSCFCSVPARETSDAVERACAAFDAAIQTPEIDPLLVIPMFILDFLCICPFSDGSGRMSRLLTLLLLCRAGYSVGKYISLEQLIERSKDTYSEVLLESTCGWQENTNDYAPFVRYLLGTVVTAYRDLSSQVQRLTASGQSKPDRVREIIKGTPGKITKAEIMGRYPDISQITVQRTLNDLLKRGQIIKLSGGRYTAYTWNRETD